MIIIKIGKYLILLFIVNFSRRYIGIKKLKVVLVAAVFLSGISFINPSESYAWQCEKLEPKEALKTYESVFSGKVIAIKQERVQFPNAIETKTRVTFEVFNIWQGINQTQVNVVGMPGLLEFEKGKTYLVYAYTQKEDKHIWKAGDLVTGVCSSVKLTKADYHLQQLGQGQKPSVEIELVKNYHVKVISMSIFLLLLVALMVYRITKWRKRI